MSGFIDGVSKIWILDRDHRVLAIHGFSDEIEAIDCLIRRAMVRDDGDTSKAAIRQAVEIALRHVDESIGGEDDGEDEEDLRG